MKNGRSCFKHCLFGTGGSSLSVALCVDRLYVGRLGRLWRNLHGIYCQRETCVIYFFVRTAYIPVYPSLDSDGKKHGKKGNNKLLCEGYVLFAAAIGVGILFFHMPGPRQTIVDYFKYSIIQAGWIRYPAS
ncbi:MAG: hypothetical protein K2K70_12245 [Lachnospiraceae bacterium]|nr:hypothetical protein [Lachnospiraceae bacterium]